MIELTLPYLLQAITAIINVSRKSSKFPDIWKVTFVKNQFLKKYY